MLFGQSPVAELPWQVVAGIVILTTTLIYWTRRRSARAGAQPRVSASRPAAMSRRRDNESELRDLLLEVEKLTREATAQIDTRYRKLEFVIREADRRIQELCALTAPSAESSDASTPTRGLNIVIDEDGITETVAAQPAPKEKANLPHDRALANPHADDRAAVYEQVCSLADNQLPPREIAARVGRPIGEVELMLGLRAERISADQ